MRVSRGHGLEAKDPAQEVNEAAACAFSRGGHGVSHMRNATHARQMAEETAFRSDGCHGAQFKKKVLYFTIFQYLIFILDT